MIKKKQQKFSRNRGKVINLIHKQLVIKVLCNE